MRCMDKRIISGAAALLVFSSVTAGCNEKKKPVPSDDTGVFESESSEPLFREYTDEDFREINIPLTYKDNAPPMEIGCIDISGFDFGEKVPVCNKEEFAEEYYTNRFESYNGTPVYNWKSFAGKSVKGYSNKCYVWNGKCYIYVTYECFEYADWSLYSCDLSGSSLKEIYSWTAKDLDERCYRNVFFSEGSMFFTYYGKDGNIPTAAAKRLDLETAEITTLYEAAAKDISIWLNTDDSGNAELQEYHNVSEIPTVIYKYDSDKDEFVKEKEAEVPEGKIMASNSFNGVYSCLIKPEHGHRYDLVNDYYRVKTSVTTGRIVYADEKLAILYNNVKLHIYDLEKMEHCFLDISDLGSSMAMYDGKLFIGCRSNEIRMPVYCMIPELGITYPIVEEGIYSDIRATADGVTFNEISRQENVIRSGAVRVDKNGEIQEEYSVMGENGGVSYVYVGGYSNQYDKIDKIYTVKMK